jgi:hypothetical protein
MQDSLYYAPLGENPDSGLGEVPFTRQCRRSIYRCSSLATTVVRLVRPCPALSERFYDRRIDTGGLPVTALRVFPLQW